MTQNYSQCVNVHVLYISTEKVIKRYRGINIGMLVNIKIQKLSTLCLGDKEAVEGVITFLKSSP